MPLFFIFFFVIFFGVIGLIIWLSVRNTTARQAPPGVHPQQHRINTLLAERAGLALWTNSTAICASMRYSFSKGFTRVLSGKIFSSTNQPLLAFDRVEDGIGFDKGTIAVVSSAFHFFVDYSPGNFTVWFNGQPFGQVMNGIIISRQGVSIGKVRRPESMSVDLPLVSYNTGKQQYPVYLHGRVVATINVSSGGGSDALISVNENPAGQQTIRLHASPTAEEEGWLIVLAVMEVAVHGYTMG